MRGDAGAAADIEHTLSLPRTRAWRMRRAAGGVVITSSGTKCAQPCFCASLNCASASIRNSVFAVGEGVSLPDVLRIAIATACLVVTVLGVSATTFAADGPAQSPYEHELQFCVDRTNEYRATVGLPALSRSADLEQYADAAARNDGNAHKAHQYFKKTRGGGIALAENVIPWWSLSEVGSVQAVVDRGLAMMWAEGKGGGHYRNLTGRYRTVGCGVFVNGDRVTVVQAMR